TVNGGLRRTGPERARRSDAAEDLQAFAPTPSLGGRDRSGHACEPARGVSALKVLKLARLVADRAEGTRRLYAVDSRGLEDLREWLNGFWEQALAAFQEAAENEAAKEKKR